MARRSRKNRRQAGLPGQQRVNPHKQAPEFTHDLDPQEVLKQYDTFIHAIIHDIQRSFPRTRTMTEDLHVEGQIGLLDAYKRFDPDAGCAFSSYAYYRVKGSIIDGLRRVGVFQRKHKSPALQQAACRLGEARQSAEGAPETASGGSLDAALNNVDQTIASMGVAWMLINDSLSNKEKQQHHRLPERVLLSKEAHQRLHLALNCLDKEEHTVITRVYFEDRSLADVARELKCSRSWTSRVHSRALRALAKQFQLSETPNSTP